MREGNNFFLYHRINEYYQLHAQKKAHDPIIALPDYEYQLKLLSLEPYGHIF